MNRLGDSTSPYLRQHADNPVDWWPWGADAFAEAARRDKPVFISIGYATCHWCHVMARESFSDPIVAAYLNDNFVAVKVDREEHPDVDASYLAAAGAFTQELGWPLSIFADSAGRPFYAGTYFPPRPAGDRPEFLRILGAISDLWNGDRGEVLAQSSAIADALAAAAARQPDAVAPPSIAELDAAAAAIAAFEDRQHGGFGGAPKFPVAPVLDFLAACGGEASALAERTLKTMGASPLRDPVEGGFFRYATRADWTEPHYERMLYDNAQLLLLAAGFARNDDASWARVLAESVAGFLVDVLQLPSGGFASAQDSESIVDGRRSEGGYYRADRDNRARLTPPALDAKVLSGWNGLAIGALATAGFVLDRPELTDAARRAADTIIATHVRGDRLVRSSLDGRASQAPATLEDHGMLAGGLLRLAAATGEAGFAVTARTLVETTLGEGGFAVPADPVLQAQGLALGVDTSEGAYPSGLTACADAAWRLYLLTAEARHLHAARDAMSRVAADALARPMAYGGSLALMRRLAGPVSQLVTVTSDEHGPLAQATRGHAASVAVVVTEAQARAFADAGFELFAARTAGAHGQAYLCSDFVCRLPVARPDQL